MPHGFLGLYGLDRAATAIMEEAGRFLAREGGGDEGVKGGAGGMDGMIVETGLMQGETGEEVACDVGAAVGGEGLLGIATEEE